MSEIQPFSHIPPPPAENLPQAQGLDKPIKVDLSDDKATLFDMAARITKACTLIGLSFGTDSFAHLDGPEAWGAKLVLLGAGYELVSHVPNIFKHINKNLLLSDNDLKYRADRSVYKGKSLRVGNQTMEAGDNFYYIRMPTLDTAISSAADMDTWLDVHEFALRDIKGKIVDKNYEFIAVEIGSNEANSLSAAHTQATKEVVFANKNTIPEERGQNVALFTREQFENLTQTPQDLFLKAADALGDSMFSDFLSHARTATTNDERDRIKDLMTRQLDQILEKEVEYHFNNTGDIQFGRSGPNRMPTRNRVYPLSMIRKTEAGMYFVKVDTTSGDARWTPLKKMLDSDLTVDQIIDGDKPIKKAQLAYFLENCITTTPIESLVREKAKTREEVLQEMEALKLRNYPKPIESTFKPHFSRIASKTLRSALGSATLFLAVAGGIREMDKIKSPAQSFTTLETSEPVRFPGKSPNPGLEWKIDGNLPSDGYYITDTASKFKKGEWINDTDIKHKLDKLPDAIPNDSELPHINLSRPEITNSFGDTKFKIPILHGTTVGGLRITDPVDNNVPYEVFELTDGTFEVKLKTGRPYWVNVVTSLIPASTDTIHATKKVKPVDEKKLSEKAKYQLNLARSLASKDDPLSGPFTEVATYHRYSINPPGIENLTHASTEEETLNAIAEFHALACEVANTQAVFESSTIPTAPAVNIAKGYIAVKNHPGGAGGEFIRSETSHEFAIDEKGQIYDATPGDIADDEETQKYINTLQNYYGSPENWDKVQANIQRIANEQEPEARKRLADQERLNELGEIAGLLFGGVGGAFAISKAKELADKHITEENIKIITDELVLSTFSGANLKEAQRFFTWLSWGSKDSGSPNKKKYTDKKTTLIEISENTNLEKLAQYVEDPKAFERIANEHGFNIKGHDANKIRQLATYLLSS